MPEHDEPLIHQIERQARIEAEMDDPAPPLPDEEYDAVAERDPRAIGRRVVRRHGAALRRLS